MREKERDEINRKNEINTVKANSYLASQRASALACLSRARFDLNSYMTRAFRLPSHRARAQNQTEIDFLISVFKMRAWAQTRNVQYLETALAHERTLSMNWPYVGTYISQTVKRLHCRNFDCNSHVHLYCRYKYSYLTSN